MSKRLSIPVIPFVLALSASWASAATIDSAEAALAAGDADSALEQVLTVLETDPDNPEALDLTANLGMLTGMPGLARDSLLHRAGLLVAAGDKAAVRSVHEQLSGLNATQPEWVDQQLQAIAQVTEEQAPAYQDWSAITQDAQMALEGGDPESAIAAQETALMMALENFGEEHWITIVSYRDLGFLYRQMGNAEAADQNYQEALARATGLLGESHPQTLEILGMLAELYQAAGMGEQALSIQMDVINGLTQGLGAANEMTLSARYSLISWFESAGDYQTALAEIESVCSDIVDQYGAWHPQAVDCIYYRASTEQTLGQTRKAADSYREVISLLAGTQPAVNDYVF
ncbi:MAG: tetratricopeptide repeat protein, partial [Pseudomonadales bacterium]|nr:tetratricopeptide repeat protein [Pseudomonadales bacterium]